MTRVVLTLALLLAFADRPAAAQADVAGVLMRWHPVTLTFDGPHASESGTPNPFRDHQLTIDFWHMSSGDVVTVPGYFAADGDAAETGATSGTKWRAHFTPHRVGTWRYAASFRTGDDVALDLDAGTGTATAFDGATGSFEVAETDKTGRDFRGRGLLRYVGERYLRLDNGTYFVKGGADSPENLLAYVDFDGTYTMGPPGEQRAGEAPTASLHRYASHADDWNAGDPTWQDGKGKALIGALNYLAGTGANAFSFLTMNVGGDGKDVWPWTAPDARDRYDVSKLAQWDVIFSHADSLGLFLHFKTQETENDTLLDGGTLGPERRLYYRELVARFGHHLALNWNLGEENDLWDELDDPEQTHVKSHIDYLHALDPYDHPVVLHTYPDQHEQVYGPLLGDASGLDGVSIQTAYDNVHDATLKWVRASQEAGKPWVVANDEQGHYTTGVTPDGPHSNRDAIRRYTLWGNLMAGGAGVEYYFGYEYAHNDLDAEDWRSRADKWNDIRHALAFFDEHLPFTEMHAADALTPAEDDYVFAQPGGVYAVYLPEGGPAKLDLQEHLGTYDVAWYDPRHGGTLQRGSVREVTGGTSAALGTAPEADGQDWIVLVRRTGQ